MVPRGEDGPDPCLKEFIREISKKADFSSMLTYLKFKQQKKGRGEGSLGKGEIIWDLELKLPTEGPMLS